MVKGEDQPPWTIFRRLRQFEVHFPSDAYIVLLDYQDTERPVLHLKTTVKLILSNLGTCQSKRGGLQQLHHPWLTHASTSAKEIPRSLAI